MYTAKERARYNEDRAITCKRLNITENQYNWFRREGLKLHKLYEDNCNGVVSEDQYYAKALLLEKPINDKAKTLGLFVFFQTDPRGATVYLDKVAIPENNYTNAQCIY
jgi:hypothetical protein